MKNAVPIRTVLTTLALAAAAHAGPEAAAGVVAMDQPAPDTGWSSDLSSLTIGQAVSEMTFEPISASELTSLGASVATDSPTNEISANGWWRLRGTTTTIVFDHALTSARFEFAHEKNASVGVAFLDSTGGVLDLVTLDGKVTPTGSVSYSTDAGGSFTSMRLTWTRATGHAMRLGPVFTVQPETLGVPGPGVPALAGVGVGLLSRRRRV